MTKKILKYPNRILNKSSSKVKNFDSKLNKLIQNLKDTLKASRGIGIVAPQIGSLKCVIIIKALHPGAPIRKQYILINPEIEKYSDNTIDSIERCLSIPKKEGSVKRYEQITIKYRLPSGEERRAVAYGEESRTIQHEMDHLAGILFTSVAEQLWNV